jgi:hypothetical protein
MNAIKNGHASAAAIRRAKTAIERTGSVVRSVKVFADGTMEFILGAENDDAPSEFDRLEAAGRL